MARIFFFGGGAPIAVRVLVCFLLFMLASDNGSICCYLVTEPELFDLCPCGFPMGY